MLEHGSKPEETLRVALAFRSVMCCAEGSASAACLGERNGKFGVLSGHKFHISQQSNLVVLTEINVVLITFRQVKSRSQGHLKTLVLPSLPHSIFSWTVNSLVCDLGMVTEMGLGS